jgi:hypothetical protein
MTNQESNPKTHLVRLPDGVVAKCEGWAAEMVAHYRSGDPQQAMPWTRDEVTDEQLRKWLISRKEAGRAINIETCELGRWPANDMDPYGIRETLGEEVYCQVGTNRFVRSPETRGWVWEGDLPAEKGKAMYDRIHREWEHGSLLRGQRKRETADDTRC